MNAARFARNLVEDGVDPKLAQSLAEHLADAIEGTAARTRNHWAAVEGAVMRHFDSVEQAVLTKMDANFRRSMIWVLNW